MMTEPLRKTLSSKHRQELVSVYSKESLHHAAIEAIRIRPVKERSRESCDLTDFIRAAQHSLSQVDAIFFRIHCPCAHDEARDIDQEFMRRRIGALDETQLAVVAEVDELSDLTRVELVRVVVHFFGIKVNEESWKGRAEVKTKAAGVADVVLAAEFLVERLGVPIVRFIPFDRN